MTKKETTTNNPSSSADRRQSFRAPIELRVEYSKMNTFFADYTKNISKGGTFIKTEKPLPVGTEFVFKLKIPKRANTFQLRGEVVWINSPGSLQNPEIPDIGMGIKFIFANEEQRLAFEAEVEKMMIDALGANFYDKFLKETK